MCGIDALVDVELFMAEADKDENGSIDLFELMAYTNKHKQAHTSTYRHRPTHTNTDTQAEAHIHRHTQNEHTETQRHT